MSMPGSPAYMPAFLVKRDKQVLAGSNQVLELNPQDSQAIAQQAETLRLRGRYEEALAGFCRAIKLEPDYAWAIAHRGETFCLLGRYEEALVDLNRAIALEPDYAWALAHRGEILRLMKCYDKALADFCQAIELKPDYAWAFACRCLIYEQMRRYEEALADFDCVIALDKTIFNEWRSDRGMLLSFCGRYEEAIEYCEQRLKENPDDYLLLYPLAVIKARWQGVAAAQAQIDQARAALQAVIEADSSGAIHYRLGGLAAVEGYPDQALFYLQAAISLRGGRFETARHDLAWLDLRADPRFQALSERS